MDGNLTVQNLYNVREAEMMVGNSLSNHHLLKDSSVRSYNIVKVQNIFFLHNTVKNVCGSYNSSKPQLSSALILSF
jgi:competence transcription factor ComK